MSFCFKSLRLIKTVICPLFLGLKPLLFPISSNSLKTCAFACVYSYPIKYSGKRAKLWLNTKLHKLLYTKMVHQAQVTTEVQPNYFLLIFSCVVLRHN